jgi:iron complex outermembrane receptor protein
MNAKAEYSFLQRSLSVFAEIDNVFNRQYSDLLGAVMPGSWFIGGIKFQWAKKQQ